MRPRIPSPALRCLRNGQLPAMTSAAVRPTIILQSNVSPLQLSQGPSASYASVARATVPSATAVKTYPSTQPPSYKAPTSLKTLLQRLYLSLLRSSPLTIVFQHSSVRPVEWIALRRELGLVLNKVDAGLPPGSTALAPFIKINVVDTALFGVAVRIADQPAPGDKLWAYGASREAYRATISLKKKHPLAPLLIGPLALLTFPALSPPHITAALDLLFPVKKVAQKKGFDPLAMTALQKIILLGARVQERVIASPRVLDDAGIRYLCDLKSVDELRGEMVALLTSVGGGEIVRTLESVPINLGRTIEGRRKMLEEAGRGGKVEGEVKAG
ncbi:hypothetical protein BDZ91DRAFT_745974 [Kalaharituber pfeilii]|nr:hypothetical protein BDZ91DRAFT_745974 [Kalaharituber pfeilii]